MGAEGSIYRFSGTARDGEEEVPWSLILKALRAIPRRRSPSAFNYWRREPSIVIATTASAESVSVATSRPWASCCSRRWAAWWRIRSTGAASSSSGSWPGLRRWPLYCAAGGLGASLLPLVVLGFVAFAEAVWNTSHVRREADPASQAQLQSFTSMAFALGSAVGALWGGYAIDLLGIGGLYVGAGASQRSRSGRC